MPADEEDVHPDDNSSDKTSAPARPLLTGADFRGESLDRRLFGTGGLSKVALGFLAENCCCACCVMNRDPQGESDLPGCGGCCCLKAFLGEDSSR